MRIRVLSDLHLEFRPLELSEVPADVVVLAGDTAPGPMGVRWARERFPRTPVVYVAGNHEAYGHSLPSLYELLRREAAGSTVHVLEEEAVELDGVEFLGCTLWTDQALFGDPVATGGHLEAGMNDYRVVWSTARGERWTAADARSAHARSRAWLEQRLEAAPARRLHIPSGLPGGGFQRRAVDPRPHPHPRGLLVGLYTRALQPARVRVRARRGIPPRPHHRLVTHGPRRHGSGGAPRDAGPPVDSLRGASPVSSLARQRSVPQPVPWPACHSRRRARTQSSEGARRRERSSVELLVVVGGWDMPSSFGRGRTPGAPSQPHEKTPRGAVIGGGKVAARGAPPGGDSVSRRSGT